MTFRSDPAARPSCRHLGGQIWEREPSPRAFPPSQSICRRLPPRQKAAQKWSTPAASARPRRRSMTERHSASHDSQEHCLACLPGKQLLVKLRHLLGLGRQHLPADNRVRHDQVSFFQRCGDSMRSAPRCSNRMSEQFTASIGIPVRIAIQREPGRKEREVITRTTERSVCVSQQPAISCACRPARRPS